MVDASQKDKDDMLVRTLNFLSDSIIELDKRLRRVEEGLKSTQDAMLALHPDQLNKSDIGEKEKKECTCGVLRGIERGHYEGCPKFKS